MKKYRYLDNLMKSYLNQDALEITGASDLPGMIDYYFNDIGKNGYTNLNAEIYTFKTENSDVNKAFAERFRHEWDVGKASEFFHLIQLQAEKLWPEIIPEAESITAHEDTGDNEGDYQLSEAVHRLLHAESAGLADLTEALNVSSDSFLVSELGKGGTTYRINAEVLADLREKRRINKKMARHLQRSSKTDEFSQELLRIAEDPAISTDMSLKIINALRAKRNQEIGVVKVVYANPIRVHSDHFVENVHIKDE
jgi:hypothetical protein